MKKIYFWLVLMFFCGLMFSSCKKELPNSQSNLSFLDRSNPVLLIKEKFSKKPYLEKLNVKLNDSIGMKWEPQWNDYQKVKMSDTLEYFYFKLKPLSYNPRTDKPAGKEIVQVDYQRYLLVGQGNNSTFYKIATYYSNSQSKKITKLLSSGISDFKNFTGDVSYTDLDLETTNRLSYINGASTTAKVNNKQIIHVDYAGCTTASECWYNIECSGVYFTRVIQSKSGCSVNYNGSTPPNCQPSSIAQGWYLSASYPILWCDGSGPYPDPDLPPDPVEPVVLTPDQLATMRIEKIMFDKTTLTEQQKILVGNALGTAIQDFLAGGAYCAMLNNNVVVHWRVDPNINEQAFYDYNDNSIVIKDPLLISPSKLGEELYHYYQLTTMGVFPPGTIGSANIEYEYFLVRDIQKYIELTNAHASTSGIAWAITGNDYLSYLNSVTNGGTQYPTYYQLLQTYHQLPNNYRTYHTYMSIWLSQLPNNSPYKNNQIDYNLLPTGMFELFNNSPCNQ